MTDIFLSYSSADRAKADLVQQALTAAGYDVAWDQEIPPGQDWDVWIRERLNGAKLAVVLWSKTSIASGNVRHEAMIANKERKLIPAQIENFDPTDLPMGMYVVQGVNLSDYQGGGEHPGMVRLLAEIYSRLKHGAPPPPAAIQPEAKPSSRLPMFIGAALLAAVAVIAVRPLLAPSHKADAEPAAVTSVETPAPKTLADQLVGAWIWGGDQKCGEGPIVSRTPDGGLQFRTKGSPDYVHEILSDDGALLHTKVTAPKSEAGVEMELRLQGDTLLIQTIGDEHVDTWTRCL